MGTPPTPGIPASTRATPGAPSTSAAFSWLTLPEITRSVAGSPRPSRAADRLPTLRSFSSGRRTACPSPRPHPLPQPDNHPRRKVRPDQLTRAVVLLSQPSVTGARGTAMGYQQNVLHSDIHGCAKLRLPGGDLGDAGRAAAGSGRRHHRGGYIQGPRA